MDKKILKWNFIFQYGWVLTNIFNSILLLPLYLKNIDADTLGLWLATGSILAWMTLVDPGVGEVLQQRIAEARGKKEHSEIGRFIGSGFVASALILLISVILGYVCYFSLGSLINKNIEQYPHLSMALVLSVLATGLSLVSFSISGINQGLHNSAMVAICSLSANFFFLFVNLFLLFMGFGVLSIAIANLARAFFIVTCNITSLLNVLKKMQIRISFESRHFGKFIRIFSFTSTSKIISGLSYSVDMLVLARFISPAMITLYEISKRPISITYSLIGRHSVALMPLVSYSQGSGDKTAILQLINKQFKFYSYAALFASLMFWLNYDLVINAWTGPGHYPGNLIVYLLIANFFCSLLSFFMANIGYALGDIKKNSLFNIVRGCVYGVLMFFAAKHFGIVGTLVVSLCMAIIADFIFYYYRVYRLGYLDISFFKALARPWSLIISAAIAGGWSLKFLIDGLLPADMYFPKLIIISGFFSLIFFGLLVGVDKEWRNISMKLGDKYVFMPLNKLIGL